MTLVFTSKANNNGFVYAKGGSAFKPNTMAQGSMITNATAVYANKAGGGKNWYGASDYTAQKRRIAIGKNHNRIGVANGQPSGNKSTDSHYRNSALARVRGGGAVAPKKKGANPGSASSKVPVRSNP